jgi:hypothetical protein
MRLRRDAQQVRPGTKRRQRRRDLSSGRIDVNTRERETRELHVRIFSEVAAFDGQQRVIRGDGHHSDHRLLRFFSGNHRCHRQRRRQHDGGSECASHAA